VDILTGDRPLAWTELGMELWHAAVVKHFMQQGKRLRTTDAQEETVASCIKENVYSIIKKNSWQWGWNTGTYCSL